jgi:ABC-2 type transport system permease protein
VAIVAFLVSVLAGVVVCFAIRMLVALSAFWLLDASGLRMLMVLAGAFLSGLTVPLVLFPGVMRDVVMALPWAAFVQVPADIWLGQRSGGAIVSGLAFQAAWAGALLLACGAVRHRAGRKLVVQGG